MVKFDSGMPNPNPNPTHNPNPNQVVKFDSGMRDELRCPSCKNMLREPMVSEEGVTLCRGCTPIDTVAVPNYIIETLAGRQDYKNATRDPGVQT